jgi:hypothetical protein
MYTLAGLTIGKTAPASRNSALRTAGSRCATRPAKPTIPDE